MIKYVIKQMLAYLKSSKYVTVRLNILFHTNSYCRQNYKYLINDYCRAQRAPRPQFSRDK